MPVAPLLLQIFTGLNLALIAICMHSFGPDFLHAHGVAFNAARSWLAAHAGQ